MFTTEHTTEKRSVGISIMKRFSRKDTALKAAVLFLVLIMTTVTTHSILILPYTIC